MEGEGVVTPEDKHYPNAGAGASAEGWTVDCGMGEDEHGPAVWRIKAPDGESLFTHARPQGLVVALMQFAGIQSISVEPESV